MDSYIHWVGEKMYGIEVEGYEYEDCAAARADLRERGEKAMTPTYQEFLSKHSSVKIAQSVEAFIYHQDCAGCHSSSAYSDFGAMDDWTPSAALMTTSDSIDLEMILPLIVALLVIINCVCFLYICIRNCMTKKNVYKVVRYESETETEHT